MGRKICQHWLQIEIFLFFILNHTIGRYAIILKSCSQVLLNLFFDTQILALLSCGNYNRIIASPLHLELMVSMPIFTQRILQDPILQYPFTVL